MSFTDLLIVIALIVTSYMWVPQVLEWLKEVL